MSGDGGEPFVETRSGGWFFLNAVLAAPALLVLIPFLVRGVVRGMGGLNGPSPLLDPLPEVAGHVLPAVGWLAALPLWTSWRNLGMAGLPAWARAVLRGFLVLHGGTLAVWLAAVVA